MNIPHARRRIFLLTGVVFLFSLRPVLAQGMMGGWNGQNWVGGNFPMMAWGGNSGFSEITGLTLWLVGIIDLSLLGILLWKKIRS